MRRTTSNRLPFGASAQPLRRPFAALLAFLLAIAFSPMLLAGPADAQTAAPEADRALTMDVNGLSSPDEAFVFLGGLLRYKLVATNNGPDTEPAALVQGQIVPWPATFDRFETDDGTYVDVDGFGTWTIGALAPGESVTLFVYATATTQATRQTAQATISGDALDPNPDNNQGAAFFTVLDEAPPDADIGITKTVDNATPAEGDTIVYIVKAANFGPADATNVRVADELPNGITYVSDDSGGAYDPAAGVWAVGDLTSGATATLQITGTVDTGTAGSTITNRAELLFHDQNDPNPDNDKDTAIITVQETSVEADLALAKTVDDPTPAEGDTIVYTVSVTNGGPVDATGIQIADRLPGGITYVSDDSGGAYDAGSGLWTIGDLANGDTATLNITLTVNAGTAGFTIVNDATVSALDQDDPNPDNDSDTAIITVQGANLSISKTVDNPTPAERATVVYTVTVTNGGPDSATGVEVTDQLPTGLTYNADDSGGAYDPVTGVWTTGSLPHGDTATLNITAIVNVGTAGDTITNTATITASDPTDPDPGNTSDSADIRVVGADLQMIKTVDNASPGEGDTIVYSLLVGNHGPDDTTGVEVWDELPAGVTYVSDDSTGAYDPVTGVWIVGDLTNGDLTVLKITATVDVGTTGSTIVNHAEITETTQDDPDLDNNSDFVGITVSGADIGITKNVSDANPAEGDTIVYTLTALNGGPDDATGVVVTDQLPAGVTWVSDTSGGAYDPGTGIWTAGSIANGGFETLRITATVDAGTAGTTITNTATIAALDQNDPNPDNDTDSVDIDIAGADLRLAKTVDEPNPSEGGTIVYTITALNGGPDDATGVAVTDELPTGVTYVGDIASAGAYDDATGVWTIGNLANGDFETLTITATVDAGTTGTTITNTAEITASDQADPDPTNSTASASITVAGADLGIVKTVDIADPSEGDTIVYTVSVTNGGPDDTTGVVITDQLPTGVTWASDTSGGDYDDTTGVWTVGNLANGATATIAITATVDAGTTGSIITNTASITAVDQNDPNPGNDTDSADIRVAGTDLGITKTVDDTAPIEGQTITYTVILANHGPDDATNVVVTDQLPTEVTWVSDNPSVGTYDPGTGLWTVGNINNGSIEVLTITATVNPGTAGTTIINTATITALDQNDPNPDNDTDSAGAVVTGADLDVAKTVDVANPSEGDTIVYTVSVTNGGPDDATGVAVTDQLPTGVTWVSDNSGGTYVPGTGIWTIGAIANGMTATVTITATVDAGTTGSIITNIATVTALDQDDPNPDNDTDSADITVAGADLGIVKTVDIADPSEGDTIVYTVSVTNGGPDDTTGVVITDQLPTGVTWASDTSGGDYDDTTGVWTVGNLANGATATIAITATVDAGTTGSIITNTASITAVDQNDPNPGNDTDSADIRVAGTDLGITKTVDDTAPIEGQTITYTVILANHGPDDATNVVVTDQLPTEVTWVSDNPSVGTYDPGTGLWTVGNINNGSIEVLTITATVNPGTAGTTIINTATITALDQNDPNPDNDTDSAGAVVTGADLDVAKTVDVANPSEGDTIVYTVSVTNGGPDDATGVAVTDQLPTGVTWVSDNSGGTYVPGTGIWTIGAIANGMTATVTITATVDAGTTGSIITNIATVTALDQDDPNPDNDTDSADITVAGADLGIVKTVDIADPAEGDTITYTLTVTNGGPDDTTGVAVTDELPTGVTYVSDDSTGAYDPVTGIWTIGNLANGTTATLAITATVDAGTTGSIITNTATITASDQNDPNPGNDTDSADITVAGTDLDIVKTVSDTTPSEGDTITYNVIVANHGPDDATGVEITDQLPAGVTYVSDSPSVGTYDTVTGEWNIGNLDVGNGLEVLTITATVDTGTTGDTITNTARISDLDQNDPNQDNDTDSVDIMVAGADLSVTKTVDIANPSEGDTIVYTVSVTNGGPDDATGVEIADQLPAGVTYVSDDSGGDYDSGTGTWAVGDIDNGATTTIAITATVDTGTTGDIITNTSAVQALDQNDPNPDNDTDSADITVAGADLGITKTVSDPRPDEGDTIVYTLILANHGPDDATGVEITDILPLEVSYVSDDAGGDYNDATGIWDVGDLNNGSIEVLEITVTVNAGTTGTVIVNTATIMALDQNDPNQDNDSDSAGSIVAGTDLSVTKTVDNANPSEGDTIIYTVHVTNGGPDGATGVELTDELPSEVTYVSDDSGDSYDPITGIWNIGDIANAETATITITATVKPGTTGDTFTNTATVTALDQNDPNPDNDSDSATVRVAGTDLAVVKTVSDTTPNEGDTIDYTVIVANRGPDDATSIEVTDELPAGVTYVSDTSGGTYDPASGIWTIGNIDAGNAVDVLTITVTVDSGTAGDTIVNTATITARDQNDPNPDNDTNSVTITVAGADLSIAKTVDEANPSVGDTIVYTIRLTNGGPDDATGIEVTDQLPEGVTYVSDTSGGTYNPGTGIWGVAALANGATATLQITATVDAGTAGTKITNTATVTASDQSDPNPDDNTDSADIDVAGADLRILKAVDEHFPNEGDTITYAVIVVNAGPDDATGIEVTDQLPAGVTYVSDDTGGAYDPVTGIWVLGDLANGDVAIAKIIVTVDAGTSGSIIINKATITAADQDDPDPSNNTDRVTIIVAGADIGLVKTVNNATPSEGDTVVYAVTVTNGGPKKATGVEVTDQLPAGVTYASDNSGGAYDPATGIWTIGDLANGNTATLEITATIDTGTAGTTLTNTATVTASDQVDPNPDNDSDTADITVANPVNSPPSPVEPDDEGNLVPIDSVSDAIAVGETPKALDIVDPEGDAFTVVIQTGTLPAGVTMDDQGVFSGAATQTGTFVLTMETCDDRTPQACSTFTYTLTVDEELPVTGIETTQIAIAGLAALILGALMLVATSRRRDEDGQGVAR